jgi:uncharacterized membrane protein YfcA
MNPLLSDPVFYLCSILAVLVFGFGKGGFGGATGVLSVPLMTFAMPPQQAAAILLPILCVMDILTVKKYWGRWHRQNLIIMIPAAIFGIALGSLTFRMLSDDWIRVLVGIIATGFALYMWVGRKSEKSVAKPSVKKGRFWGMVSGFTSFGIHAGGLPAGIYLLPQRLPPTEFVATSVVLFAVINYVKLIPYFWLGQLSTANLLLSFILLPFAPIGIWLGFYLHDKISVQLFYRVVNFFLVLAGLKLLYEGIANLIA